MDDESLFIHPPVEGCLGCFQFGVIINKDTKHVYRFLFELKSSFGVGSKYRVPKNLYTF